MEDTWHFLRNLLGSHHALNPWVPTPSTTTAMTTSDCTDTNTAPTTTMPDMVLLQLPHSIKVLRDFRVGDACPSWFFHGYVHLTPTTMPKATTTTEVLYIYKRLKPRIHLFRRHPQDGTPAIPEGCLWERLPVTAERCQGDDDDKDEMGHEQTTAPLPTYRVVNPPYLNLEQEYGTAIANGLFSDEALEIFRSEALAIPQWTPWPETQHYSVGPNGETTWTVFPLCYCFPAHDVSQRTWVSHTRHYCPRTCDVLDTVLGETLRTALFSQLHPETTLEAHTGWADLANAVLRLHIPLVVPSASNGPGGGGGGGGLCGTWVDGCVETHHVGRPILFDDSKIHRAFNYHGSSSSSSHDDDEGGGGKRIVLIVDLARPESLPQGYATGGHSDELDAFIAQMNVPK